MSCHTVTLWSVNGSKVGGRDIKKGQVPIAGAVVGKVGRSDGSSEAVKGGSDKGYPRTCTLLSIHSSSSLRSAQ